MADKLIINPRPATEFWLRTQATAGMV